MQRVYRFLGACSCWGAQVRTCERGPEDLLDSRIFERLKQDGAVISEIAMLYPKQMASNQEIPLSESLPLIYEFNLRLAALVSETIERNEFPITVAGDHSSAVGTWNGVRKAVAKKSGLPIGLLWIDAHMDSHTPETTPSGAWHGMPVAALMGFGAPELAKLLDSEPVLEPEHVVILGVRSFEKGEVDLLKKLNVKIYFIEEIRKRGFSTVLKEAIEKVSAGTFGFGVSIDVDVIDPKEAPGVGSPEEGGISSKELLDGLPLLGKSPKALGFEVVEYNPQRDVGHRTRELVYKILKGLTV